MIVSWISWNSKYKKKNEKRNVILRVKVNFHEDQRKLLTSWFRLILGEIERKIYNDFFSLITVQSCILFITTMDTLINCKHVILVLWLSLLKTNFLVDHLYFLTVEMKSVVKKLFYAV